jgi:hypothetical protein
MAIEKQKDVGSGKTESAKRFGVRTNRLISGKAEGQPVKSATLQRTWTTADEEQVLRLAEGIRIASTEGAAEASHLSDDEFVKLLVR